MGSQDTVHMNSPNAMMFQGQTIMQFNCDDVAWIGSNIDSSIAQESAKLIKSSIA